MGDDSSRNEVIIAGTYVTAEVGAWIPVQAPALAAQAIGAGGVLQGTNYRDLDSGPTVVDLATVPGTGAVVPVTTSLAYIRFSAAGAGSVRVSGAVSGDAGSSAVSPGLTDVQLRSAPLPLPTGAATAAAQDAALARTSRLDSLATRSVDEATAGTTYLLQTPTMIGEGVAWLVKRIVVASGQMTFGYAGPTNNAGQASASAAWAARASLVYGTAQEA